MNELDHHNREYRTKNVGADEIGLLQLSDSLFPTGMYTMSNGLETYFYDKKVRNASQVHDLIRVFLTQQIGPTDCVALGNSYEAILRSNVQKLIEIDQTVFAMRLLQEVRNASTRSGNQILKCISSFMNDINNDFDAAIKTENSNNNGRSNSTNNRSKN